MDPRTPLPSVILNVPHVEPNPDGSLPYGAVRVDLHALTSDGRSSANFISVVVTEDQAQLLTRAFVCPDSLIS